MNAPLHADWRPVIAPRPMPAEMLGHRGVGQLLDTVKDVKKFLNKKLRVLGVLPTLFDGRFAHSPAIWRDEDAVVAREQRRREVGLARLDQHLLDERPLLDVERHDPERPLPRSPPPEHLVDDRRGLRRVRTQRPGIRARPDELALDTVERHPAVMASTGHRGEGQQAVVVVLLVRERDEALVP